MSLLSTKGVYGLMSIYEISKGDRQNPVSLKDISTNIEVSKNYLEQVLNALRNSGFVGSIKGLKGGYFLLKTLDEITFYDVFKCIENDFCLTPEYSKHATYDLLFREYDDKLTELFKEPLSSFKKYQAEAKKYLNYVI
ncbi:RrF2 family transcriptional regulator [Campylobacter hyointestinalis]|uniref:Rrf2 family transcriptional regulator n=2 Tax=Campylobacter hyointestinalis TaxID=198 RepID=A0AAV6EFG8_CAMHY|nr:Rrf2 family transcriptional regulator [Campylobacter hyointestinalis]ANE34173.1 transcriptional regulator, IscR family [Campylobacter hyointestinalis subsp. lawsonii CCUG 27631]KAB0612779.1 Rrf2 family transcriptional regulator [Campylobacter hyointestinalis subsp. lawsonii]QKF69602.1 transcriptional regulator, IscR/Rrf2 family [Campylobacter hyointestinalis subsp. lawsonii]RAZ29396.1 Rrf2 family transcriptional regulator [Campylobacter hyointestinalis subsp. lawsonii]RAZ48770.1 Rrf2 family